MGPKQYVDEYRKNAVFSASPLQLVIMLYDGAIKFMELAKKASIENQHYEQNLNMKKAQNILIELASSVNLEVSGEIGKNLQSIYFFVYEQLILANVNNDNDLVDKCIGILSGLRESWITIEAQQKSGLPSESLESQNAA